MQIAEKKNTNDQNSIFCIIEMISKNIDLEWY